MPIDMLTLFSRHPKTQQHFYSYELKYQRVVCLSVTSETRHDMRDQRKSLRGRAPRSYSGQISPNFEKFRILESLEKNWKI